MKQFRMKSDLGYFTCMLKRNKPSH